jgi:hypothetical protein
LASCGFISWPQQVSLPSPALVHSASVPHFSQRYLLPSWLATFRPPANGVILLFLLHRLAAARYRAGAAFGDNHFRAALGAAVSFAYLVRHFVPPLLQSQ